MKFMHRLLCGVFSAALFLGTCIPAFAQENTGGGKEYVLAGSYTAPLLDRKTIYNMCLEQKDRIDYFVADDSGKVSHISSSYTGTDWTQPSLKGLNFDWKSFAIDPAGTVYAVVRKGKYEVNKKNESSTYSTYGVSSLTKEGTVKAIPNFQMKQEDGDWFQLFPDLEKKELAVSQRHPKKQSTLYVVDMETGAVKKTLKTNQQILLYANGKAFGMDSLERNIKRMRDVPIDAVVVDVSTGKEIYRKAWEFEDLYGTQGWAAGKDGTFYALSASGIYRLNLETAKYELIIDGPSNGFGKSDAYSNSIAVGDDDSIYVVANYKNYIDNTDAKNGANSILYRFVKQ